MENLSQNIESEYLNTLDWREIVWPILFYGLAVIGTVGNATIIWIVLFHENMRSVTNLFLLNLAIADCLVVALDVPLVAFQLIYEYWPFGNVLCFINEFLAATNIGVSVLTLSMISIDRYQAIMYPFKRRMGRKKTIAIMVGIWLVSIVLLSPNWIFVTIVLVDTADDLEEEYCGQLWPNPDIQEIYRIGTMIVLYFVPLVCVGYNYVRIAITLWGHKIIGEQSQVQLKQKRAKKRTVKMLIVVVLIFAVCWLPLHLIFIASSSLLFKRIPYLMDIRMVSMWLALSNSMYNPIIYCLMNARFRAGFKKAFRWCPGITYDPALDEIHFSSTTMRKSMPNGDD